MKSGEIFIEIDGEEIQACDALFQSLAILLYTVMVVRGCFEGQASRLFVTSCITWYEQNRDTLDLRRVSAYRNRTYHIESHLWVFVKTAFSVQVEIVFAGKTRMLVIEVGELDVDGPGPAHIASLGVKLSSQEGMNDEEEDKGGQGGKTDCEQ